MSDKRKTLLEVKDLKVSFFTPAGEVKAVDGISYTLKEHEVMGVVGESGSGKSVEAYSIMGLLQSPGKVVGGSITFDGEDLLVFKFAGYYEAACGVYVAVESVLFYAGKTLAEVFGVFIYTRYFYLFRFFVFVSTYTFLFERLQVGIVSFFVQRFHNTAL